MRTREEIEQRLVISAENGVGVERAAIITVELLLDIRDLLTNNRSMQ